MRDDIKDRWLKALRSGEYQQTTGHLHKDGGFCCLGVLCDVVKNDDGVLTDWQRMMGEPPYVYAFNGNGGSLPELIYKHCGLEDEDPHVRVLDENGEEDFVTLSVLNDSGKTFLEIADIIEKKL